MSQARPGPTAVPADGPEPEPLRGECVAVEAAEEPGWRLWAARLIPPLLWLAASCLAYSKFLAHPTRSVPGGADGILYAWYFEWIQHALWHLDNPLYSGAMNAPEGVNVMWNTAVLLPAVLLSPLTAAIGAVAVVGLLMTLAPVLAAASAYFVLRRLTGRTVASALAATFYGFGPFFIGQAGHLHLILAAPAVPLVFYFGYRLFVLQDRSSQRDGIGLGVVVSVTMLISEEIVALAAVIAAVAVVVAALLNLDSIRQRTRHVLVGLAWTVGVCAVVLAYPLLYQFFGRHALREGIPADQSLDVEGLVRPSGLMRFASAHDIALNHAFPAGTVENTGFLGWAMLALLAGLLGLLLVRRRRFAIWWLVTVAVSVALSLGAQIWVGARPTQHSGPWETLQRMPLLDSLVPVRFTLTTAVLVAILLAFGLAAVARRRVYWAGCALTAVVLLTFLPANRYDEMLDMRSSTFFSSASVNTIPAGAQTAVLPIHNDPDSQAQVMYWQIESGMRFDLVGGYSVLARDGVPRYMNGLPKYVEIIQSAAEFDRELTPSQQAVARESVRTTGVRYIVITDRLRSPEAAVRAAEQVTGCTAQRAADAFVCEVPK